MNRFKKFPPCVSRADSNTTHLPGQAKKFASGRRARVRWRRPPPAPGGRRHPHNPVSLRAGPNALPNVLFTSYLPLEPRLDFERWLTQQRETAPKPTDSLTQAGERVFLSAPCAMCHSIGGTGAFGNVGPDLTHLASRRTIAAGMPFLAVARYDSATRPVSIRTAGCAACPRW